MRTIILTGAAALMGMTALPVAAASMDEPYKGFEASQTTVNAEMDDSDRNDITDLTATYYSPDRARYVTWDPVAAVWNVFDAATDEVVETFAKADFDPVAEQWAVAGTADEGDRPEITDLTAAGSGFYTPDRSRFVSWNEEAGHWYVYDIEQARMIGTVTAPDFDPEAMGWQAAEASELQAGDLAETGDLAEDSDRDDITDLTVAGSAEMRWYDADRATYGIYDESTGMWSVYDAENEQLLRTVPNDQYARYDRGYTVVLPGETLTTMSSDALPTGSDDGQDGDRDDITDVTQ